MKPTLSLLPAALALATSAFCILPAQATPLIYEGFSGYTPGTLEGQTTTALGLTGTYSQPNWGSPTPLVATSTGLTFGSGTATLPVTGGAVASTGAHYDPPYEAALNTGAITGTLWGSYLFNFGSNAYAGSAFFTSFSDGLGTKAADGKISISYDPPPFTGNANPYTANAVYWFDANTTYMVITEWTNLGNLDNSGTGTGTMWLLTAANYNSLIANGLTKANLNTYKSATVSTTGTAFTLDNSDSARFGITAGGSGYTRTLDEIRWGTTLADVASAVPEPGILALVAGSMGVLALLRRRRS